VTAVPEVKECSTSSAQTGVWGGGVSNIPYIVEGTLRILVLA